MNPLRPRQVIDVHAHVIASDSVRYPLNPLSGHQSEWSRDRPVSAEQMIRDMDDAGICRMSLVQASTCYGDNNSYVADAVAAYPDRFSGVFSVSLTAPDAIANITHWRRRGLKSLRVFIAGHTASDQSARLDDPRSFPTWAFAQEHGIPINVQLRADGLVQLEVLLREFPRAVVFLDHFARPVLTDGDPYAQAASLWALAHHENLFFKYTTHNVRESAITPATQTSFVKRMVAEFGAQRIAWGSNYPASKGSLSGLLDEALMATADLSEADRDWIFAGTAQTVYPELAPVAA